MWPIIVPLFVASIFGSLGIAIVADPENIDPATTAVIALIGILPAFIANLLALIVIGVPAHLFLRRHNIEGFLSYGIAGAVPGIVLGALAGAPIVGLVMALDGLALATMLWINFRPGGPADDRLGDEK